MILDHRFEELLRNKMGTLYDKMPQKSKEMVLSYWQDRVKPNFVGGLDDDFGDFDCFIPIPGAQDDASIPIEDGCFVLTRYVYLDALQFPLIT